MSKKVGKMSSLYLDLHQRLMLMLMLKLTQCPSAFGGTLMSSCCVILMINQQTKRLTQVGKKKRVKITSLE